MTTELQKAIEDLSRKSFSDFLGTIPSHVIGIQAIEKFLSRPDLLALAGYTQQPTVWVRAGVISPKLGGYYYCRVYGGGEETENQISTIVEYAMFPNGQMAWDVSHALAWQGEIRSDSYVIEWADIEYNKTPVRLYTQEEMQKAREDAWTACDKHIEEFQQSPYGKRGGYEFPDKDTYLSQFK